MRTLKIITGAGLLLAALSLASAQQPPVEPIPRARRAVPVEQETRPATAVRPATPVEPSAPTPPVAPAVPDPDATGAPPATTNPAPPTSSGDLQVTTLAAAQFDRGVMLYNQKQFADCVKVLNAFIKGYPTDVRRDEALYRIADSYRELQKPVDAKAAFKYLLKQFPNSMFAPAASLRLGGLLNQQGDFGGAATVLRVAAEKGDPSVKPAARYLLGLCLTSLPAPQLEEGRKLLAEVTDIEPPSEYAPYAAKALAESLEKDGKFAEALPRWQKMLKLSEANKGMQAMAATKGGWAAWRVGNAKEARALFEQSRKIDAGADWRKAANSGLLLLYGTNGEWKSLLQLVEEEKDNFMPASLAKLSFAVGQAHFQLKQYAEAVTSFDAYLAANKTEADAPTAAYQRLLARMSLDKANTGPDCARFLADYPESIYGTNVLFLQAQDASESGNFVQALPLWEEVARSPAPDLPADRIAFQLARCYFELQKWDKAAEAFGSYVERFPKGAQALAARVRLAIALQNLQKNDDAIAAWEKVKQIAPLKSPERQSALESLGGLYTLKQNNAATMDMYQQLLAEYPESKRKGVAAFSMGSIFFQNQKYKDAEPWLLKAREWEPELWTIPATDRLARIAGVQQNLNKAIQYVMEYDEAARTAPGTPKLPVGLYLWMGQACKAKKGYSEAVLFYNAVVNHPDAGKLVNEAYLDLGRCQLALKQYKNAVASLDKFRQLDPEHANVTEVVLALAQAQLGEKDYEAAKTLSQQAMEQDVEGPANAKARMTYADALRGLADSEAAAAEYAKVALLSDDEEIKPRAMDRAAECYEKAGNEKSAANWREKLKKQYPNYGSTPEQQKSAQPK